jgi:hypothetical protein
MDGNPSFETIRSILGAMGLRLTVEPATVGEVLAWARTQIANLSGVSTDAIKLDLRIEA